MMLVFTLFCGGGAAWQHSSAPLRGGDRVGLVRRAGPQESTSLPLLPALPEADRNIPRLYQRRPPRQSKGTRHAPLRVSPGAPWPQKLRAGGVFALDKPSGLTSAEVVKRVKDMVCRSLGERDVQVGHGGTLDRFATGVLILGIGYGTKVLSRFLAGSKAYHAEVTMGTATDTQSGVGSVIGTAEYSHVSCETLESVLPQFRGDILQVPPMFSSKKRSGKRLSALAKEGKEVERSPIPVTVHSLEIERFEPPVFTLNVECSSGFYVRTLGHDLAAACGTVGHVSALRRTNAGMFSEADCMNIEDLNAARIGNRLLLVDQIDMMT